MKIIIQRVKKAQVSIEGQVQGKINQGLLLLVGVGPVSYTHLDVYKRQIINRAKEEGITPQEVADKYIAAFREDVTALGVKPATRHPRVVEFMADIIRFVEDLIEKGLSLIHI